MSADAGMARGQDFGDWMSPILVKELRQGLKTKLFVSTFIVIQVAMVLLLGMRMLAHHGQDGEDTGRLLEGLLWAALGLLMLVVMPLRGLTAISEEVKANTLDLVALTKMGSFRIVAGKWLALMAQTLLLTVAVLPYAVLRYFFGQVDIVSDLQTLAFMLMMSSVLTALCVALSTAVPAFRLIVLTFGGMSFLSFFSGFLFSRAFLRGMGTGGDMVTALLVGLCLCVCYTVFLLLETQARIATAAESHPWLRRLLPLVAFPLAGLGYVVDEGEGATKIFLPLVPMLAWALVSALTERTSHLPVVYVPWERLGFVGRFMGLVLHPGWASGVIYASVVVLASMAVWSWVDPGEMSLLQLLLCLAAVLLPVLVLQLFTRTRNRLGLYLLVQSISMLWYIIARMMSPESAGHFMQALVPGAGLMASISDANDQEALAVLGSVGTVVSLAVLLLVFVIMVREMRVLFQMHRQAREVIDAGKAATGAW